MSAWPTRIIPPPPPSWASWEAVMDAALAEAIQARDRGEVPVGALLLAGDGRLLARAGNEVEAGRDPTAHAEMLVLRRGAKRLGNHRLEGCILAVTLEPCAMCAAALAQSRVAGLVYGAKDAGAGAVESCLDLLDQPFLKHRVWHLGGILQEPCALALRQFFMGKREAEKI
ncbi:nucleoside deaminase [Desulfovibrio sp. OttesenSCG-928-G11]|nr:nucleoside deaminase [Desulfovibrio sp. OttesenSCG-928-G11]